MKWHICVDGMCPDETTPSRVELNAVKCDPCDAASFSLRLLHSPSPLAELRLLGDRLLEHLVVALQQGVMFVLELLQLSSAALQALLALGEPGPKLLHLRGKLLPARAQKQ